MVVGTALINTEANEIFQEYQEAANTGRLPFRRFPLRSASSVYFGLFPSADHPILRSTNAEALC